MAFVYDQVGMVDHWVLTVARDLATELEVPIGQIIMDPQYNNGLACTSWESIWSIAPRLMSFSRPFWSANYGNDDLLTDIVLHEMAHAMLPAAHGHDEVWSALAFSLGSNAEEFCRQPMNEPLGLRYRGACNMCAWRTSRDSAAPAGAWYYCGNPNCTGIYEMVDSRRSNA